MLEILYFERIRLKAWLGIYVLVFRKMIFGSCKDFFSFKNKAFLKGILCFFEYIKVHAIQNASVKKYFKAKTHSKASNIIL